MPDDHSEVVPLLPIPNRTVKRLSADDSAGSRVKVGHRQALTATNRPAPQKAGRFALWNANSAIRQFVAFRSCEAAGNQLAEQFRAKVCGGVRFKKAGSNRLQIRRRRHPCIPVGA
jgi:hypothetical protein